MEQKNLTKEELSVGNWVIDKSSKRMHPTARQIQGGIYNDTIYWTSPCNSVESSPYDQIEPIEITVENIEEYIIKTKQYPSFVSIDSKYKNTYQSGKYLFHVDRVLSIVTVVDKDLPSPKNGELSHEIKENRTITSIWYFKLKYIHQLQNFLTLIQ